MVLKVFQRQGRSFYVLLLLFLNLEDIPQIRNMTSKLTPEPVVPHPISDDFPEQYEAVGNLLEGLHYLKTTGLNSWYLTAGVSHPKNLAKFGKWDISMHNAGLVPPLVYTANVPYLLPGGSITLAPGHCRPLRDAADRLATLTDSCDKVSAFWKPHE